MKQLVTIFRAEGKMADQLKRLCSATPPEGISDLRDSLRFRAMTTASLTSYVEFVDAWSMGDDFERAIGPGTRVKYVPMGAVYYRSITPLMRAHTQRQARRKHQFFSQAFLSKTIANIAAEQLGSKTPALFALFRQVLTEGTANSIDKKESNNAMEDDC